MTRRNAQPAAPVENASKSVSFDPPLHSKRSRDYLMAILDALRIPYPKSDNREKLVNVIKTALADREAELSADPRFKDLYQGDASSGTPATIPKATTSAAKAAQVAAQAELDDDATATG